MTPRKTSWAVITAAALLVWAGTARADPHLSAGAVIGSHGGIGFWIGSAPRPHYYPPPHREVVVGHPWRHRVVRAGPRCEPPVVVVRPPVPVVVRPAPPVVIRSAPPVVDTEVVVWIVNSNGSKTSVTLIRRGDLYIGPRGEYYDEMPTNEQLRIVYGF